MNWRMRALGFDFAIAFVGLLVIYAISRGCGAMTCAETGEVSGRRTEFRILSGCFVEVNGKMVPLESWRGEAE